MPFDLSTATRVTEGQGQGSGGFDISTAKPVDELTVTDKPQEQTTPTATIGETLKSNPNVKLYQELIDSGNFSGRELSALKENMQGEIDRTVRFESLRSENPHLAETIEGMPQWQKSLVNIGRGMNDVGRVIGISEDEPTEELDALEDQTPGGGAARAIGQAAPFAPLGVVSSAIKTAVPRTLAYSGVGSGEGFTGATAEGEDPTLPTALGAAAPIAGTLGPKVASGIANKFIRSAEKKADIEQIASAAEPSDLVDHIESQVKSEKPPVGAEIKRLIDSSDEQHATIRKIDQAVDGGASPKDVLGIIEDQRMKATEGAGAKFKISDGKLRADPKAREAIRQGMPENEVQAIKSASSADRAKMRKMILLAERGQKSTSFRNANHPQKVVGESLLERLNYVEQVNTKAGNRLDRVARRLKGKGVDLDQATGNFLDELDGLGVTIGPNGKLDFSNSSLDLLPKLQLPVKRMMNRLMSGGRSEAFDAYDAHILKKWIDSNVTFGKSPVGGGMTPEVNGILKGLRKDVDAALDTNFADYNKVNTEYSETIGVIKSLKDLAGRNTNLAGDSADESLGMLARRVTSNAASRGRVNEAIAELEKVATKYGGEFKDSVATQSQFVTALEKKLGAFSDTSLKGELQSALDKATNGGVGGTSIVNEALNLTKAAAKKIKPKNEDKFFEALKDLINQ